MIELGVRMKTNYELPSRHYLNRKTPVIVRVDGKAFHTYTAQLDKPWDYNFMCAMQTTALQASEHMQGCKVAYTQSDEISFLLTDYDNHETQPWLGYVQNKIESITASIVTAIFNIALDTVTYPEMAFFDARAFNIPKEEVANYFLWRIRDARRNSINALAQANFSAKELNGKNLTQTLAMLEEIGESWFTQGDYERYGTWWNSEKKKSENLEDCSYGEIVDLLEKAGVTV